MKLYLVQHAEACTKLENPDRPLTEQGKATANRLAVFLRQSGVKVERIVHSGKLRAQQTAERLASALAPGTKPVVSDLIKPNDNPVNFALLCQGWQGDSLIVSHLPFLGQLVGHLVVGNRHAEIAAYTPGTIVCVEFTAKENRWSIDWMLRPELLR